VALRSYTSFLIKEEIYMSLRMDNLPWEFDFEEETR
jgi:hypothetical protein